MATWASAAASARSQRRPATWAVAATAGLTGAALAVGVLALTGAVWPRTVERAVVEKVSLAPVVSSPMLRGEPGIDDLAAHIGPAIARIEVGGEAGSTIGSGIVFRDDGLLLTSATVVAGGGAVGVVLADGRRFEGDIVGVDRPTDVAVVRIRADDLQVAVLGTADAVVVGDTALVIGAPLGQGRGPSVTTGVITATKRQVDTILGERLHGMLQTDAPRPAGRTGGALVDASGAVIGITTAAGTGEDTRFGFATPIDLARRVAAQIVETGRAVHAWLGVEGTDLATTEALALGLSRGARLRGVAADGPAAAAGLAPADVITEVGGREVASMSGLVLELRERRPGDEVVVGYWRGGRRHEATVIIGTRP